MGPGAVHSMTHYSWFAFIICTLATLLILMSPVIAGGFAIDATSCSSTALDLLGYEHQRAVTISHNSAGVLSQNDVPAAISDPIKITMNDQLYRSYQNRLSRRNFA